MIHRNKKKYKKWYLQNPKVSFASGFQVINFVKTSFYRCINNSSCPIVDQVSRLLTFDFVILFELTQLVITALTATVRLVVPMVISRTD